MLALRPNRLKNRDLWDIAWLKQQNIKLPLTLISAKVADHRCSIDEFIRLLSARVSLLRQDPDMRPAFSHEMKRFLPLKTVRQTVEEEAFWDYLVTLIETECDQVIHSLTNTAADVAFERLM